MCISPKVVPVKLADPARQAGLTFRGPVRQFKDLQLEVLTRSYRGAAGSELYRDIVPRLHRVVTVKCGHCIECLRERQNDVAVRCACEAAKRKTMHFLTLTYAPENLPIACFTRRYDPDTGEYLGRDRYRIFSACTLPEGDASKLMLAAQLRERFNRIPGSPKPKYIDIGSDYDPSHFAGVDISGFEVSSEDYTETVYTPSLHRLDVRLWLKAARVAYKRKFGEALPEFTYLCTGEYGTKKCRPHYHLLFFGLKYYQVAFLAERWKSLYGFYTLKAVKSLNKDGTPGHTICSKYVSKYVTKGDFECSSVYNRHAEGPRLQVSKHLGLSALTPALIEYYRASDLLGKCDLMTLRFEDGRYLTRSDAKYLRQEVYSRNRFKLPSGDECPLPSTFLKHIWYFKDIYYETPKKVQSVRSTPLRAAFAAVAPLSPLEDYMSSLLSDYPGISSGLFVSLVAQKQADLQNSLSLRASCKTDYLRSVYSRSKF